MVPHLVTAVALPRLQMAYSMDEARATARTLRRGSGPGDSIEANVERGVVNSKAR